MKRIHIFKRGTQTSNNGTVIDFTDAVLAEIAASYDPAKHEAPIVVGHPKSDGPAYGWVNSISFADGDLEVVPHQVDPAFDEMVTRGSFKKVSASIYLPDSPRNPVPGKHYLRHVGYLGAQPPAVKGLRATEFAEAEAGVLEFGDSYVGSWFASTVISLFRKLRDQLIDDKGVEAADKILPNFEIDMLRPEMQPAESTDIGFSESREAIKLPNHEGGDPVPKEKDQAVDFAERDAALVKAEAAIKAREEAVAAQERESARRETADFVEGLCQAGRVLPVQKAGYIEALLACDATASIEFGEGDKTVSKSARQALMDALAATPKIVEFGEVAKAGAAAVKVGKAMRVPAGYSVGAEREELHAKALQFAEANKVDYVTAVKAVEIDA